MSMNDRIFDIPIQIAQDVLFPTHSVCMVLNLRSYSILVNLISRSLLGLTHSTAVSPTHKKATL